MLKTSQGAGRTRKTGTKPPPAKCASLAEKHGKVSSGRGIRYGSRQAGRATEHFESSVAHQPHSHGSRKGNAAKGAFHKTKEQRIVSG